MEIKRTTEIFVETKRRFVVYQPESNEQFFCVECNEPMLPAEQAAAFFQIKCRTVYQLIEPGAAHFAETVTGAILVCPLWLAALLEENCTMTSGATTAGVSEKEGEI